MQRWRFRTSRCGSACQKYQKLYFYIPSKFCCAIIRGPSAPVVRALGVVPRGGRSLRARSASSLRGRFRDRLALPVRSGRGNIRAARELKSAVGEQRDVRDKRSHRIVRAAAEDKQKKGDESAACHIWHFYVRRRRSNSRSVRLHLVPVLVPVEHRTAPQSIEHHRKRRAGNCATLLITLHHTSVSSSLSSALLSRWSLVRIQPGALFLRSFRQLARLPRLFCRLGLGAVVVPVGAFSFCTASSW